LLVVTAGGGGYGDPRRRKRTEIAADLAEGFISAKRAQQDYGFDSDISDNPKKSA